MELPLLASLLLLPSLLACFSALPPYLALARSFNSRACACDSSSVLSHRVTVSVDALSPSAIVDHAFVCATLDWWPPDKCDYGTCSWGNASILNLNLSSHLLINAVKAFSPLKLRLGGTLQDQVVYDVGSTVEPCVPFTMNQSDAFKFSGGCLPMRRWDELNKFFQSTGCEVAFGLNALYGRQWNKTSPGPWDSTNARDFIQYTYEKGYNVNAWEFGNELCGMSAVGMSIPAQDYSVDMKELSKIVKEVYADQPSPPLLVAPDSFFDKVWMQDFLQSTAEGAIDVVTHHIYNLGAGVDEDLMEKILDPSYLDGEITTFRALNETLQQYGPWAEAWVGEAGGAYNSGHHLISDAFVFGFWYLDQLGMASSFGTKSYCRQSLIGGNYGLLNTTTFRPNPDYYAALLWHRLMGTKVLSTKTQGDAHLRAYGHCTKGTEGLTVLLLNLSNQTRYHVELSAMPGFNVTTREEYHLTPQGGDLHSQTSLLNGIPLEVSAEGEIPVLLPKMMRSTKPVSMEPLSIAFISLPVQIPACTNVTATTERV